MRASATLCPKEFISPNPVSSENVQYLESELVQPILDFIESCETHNISIEFSSTLLEMILESAPWQQTEDPKIRSFLDTWLMAVISPLQRSATIVTDDTDPQPWCQFLHMDVGAHFLKLVCQRIDESPKTILNKRRFGIYVKAQCSKTAECDSCILINTPSDVNALLAPWYLIYPNDLPFNGEIAFHPPKDWEQLKTPKRSKDNGYLDEQGRSWARDKLHKNHWDVQTGDKANDYLNVGYDGKRL